MVLFFRLPNFLILSFNFFPASSIVGSKVRLNVSFLREKWPIVMSPEIFFPKWESFLLPVNGLGKITLKR